MSKDENNDKSNIKKNYFKIKSDYNDDLTRSLWLANRHIIISRAFVIKDADMKDPSVMGARKFNIGHTDYNERWARCMKVEGKFSVKSHICQIPQSQLKLR